MRVLYRLAVLAALPSFTSCATHCSGRVVGTDGVPVRQALVRGDWAGGARDRGGAERVILEQTQSDNDGYFTFDSPGKPLWILADSPDLKRSGRLAPHSMIANTVVVE
jgi:hypothetical protein